MSTQAPATSVSFHVVTIGVVLTDDGSGGRTTNPDSRSIVIVERRRSRLVIALVAATVVASSAALLITRADRDAASIAGPPPSSAGAHGSASASSQALPGVASERDLPLPEGWTRRAVPTYGDVTAVEVDDQVVMFASSHDGTGATVFAGPSDLSSPILRVVDLPNMWVGDVAVSGASLVAGGSQSSDPRRVANMRPAVLVSNDCLLYTSDAADE